MSECANCAHYQKLLAQEQRAHQASFSLFVTYHNQTVAQAKGIRRLRKKIARLREDSELWKELLRQVKTDLEDFHNPCFPQFIHNAIPHRIGLKVITAIDAAMKEGK